MSMYSGDRQENASHSVYLSTCYLPVTLTFDLLTQNLIIHFCPRMPPAASCQQRH